MSHDMISLAYGVLVVFVLFLGFEGIYRLVSRKLDRLMNEVKRGSAQIITKGMMREGNIQAPCVLQVYEETLWIISLVKSKRFAIPIKDVILRKESRWWGRGLRWGRYAFHLDTPQTKRLIIAVINPGPWRNIFR